MSEHNPTPHGNYCYAHEQPILTCLAAAERRAEEAERQRDCPHSTTDWGICRECNFDYRTHDPDHNKCPKCGGWPDYRTVCGRCEGEIPPNDLTSQLAAAQEEIARLLRLIDRYREIASTPDLRSSDDQLHDFLASRIGDKP